MDRTDRRIKRTQHLLASALISLTLEKGYEAVTIRDITERADVGYATFFRHYPGGKDALLLDVVDVILRDLIALLYAESSDAEPATQGTLIFRYVQEHHQLCRVLLNSHGAVALARRIAQADSHHLASAHTPRAGSPVPPEIATHHIISASIGLIQWWLDHDMPYPPERMGTIYRELIICPTRAIAFSP